MREYKNITLRILTAFLLIPLVVWGIFALPQLYFAGINTVIILLAAWEWSRLSGWVDIRLRVLYVLLVLILLPLVQFAAYLTSFTLIFTIGSTVWLLITAYLMYVRQQANLITLPKSLVAISGLFILAICWEALLILHIKPMLLMFMLVLVWLADTFAYFGGRWLGKNKLAVTISPNKTWEGFACGVIASFVIGGIGQWFFITPGKLHLGLCLMIAVTIIVSVVGDLFESILKRQQGLKDSGQLLPGHGGVLDRLDSLLAAAPLFALAAMTTGLLE